MTRNPTLSPATSRDVREAEVAQAVRRFLADYHPDGRRGLARIGPQQNLWREVSSLTLLQLVAFVEQKFEVTVRPIDFVPQNFSTIETIARFVCERRPAPPPTVAT